MERERSIDSQGGERELTGVARAQNVLYLLPYDRAAVAQVLEPVIERLDRSAADPSVLVVTPDPETAIVVARTAVELAADGDVRAAPVTGPRRAMRLLRDAPAQVIAGAPIELLELIRASSLKLTGIRTLVVAWIDAILDSGSAEVLEAVLAEIPKEAARIVVTAQLTPSVEEFVERYARRARRVGDLAPWEGSPVDIRYVAVSPSSRPAALRRLLDDLDPPSAAVYVRTDDVEREVRDLLRALGYSGETGAVRVTQGDPAPDAALMILYQLPASRDGLRAVLAGAHREVIALVQPRELGLLRTLTGGGRIASLTLPGAGDRARRREEALRAELRAVLAGGAPAREILTIEPLLEEFDAVEIAAAALRLLERERERPARSVAAGPASSAPAAAEHWTRLFINAGARDNVAARDLVGAISGEAGISSDRIGKIELRDTHSLVEIATSDADAVVRKLTGVVLRGRRLVARIDKDRPPRDAARDRTRDDPDRQRGGSRERTREVRRSAGSPRDDRADRRRR